jgi:hypothetical protein
LKIEKQRQRYASLVWQRTNKRRTEDLGPELEIKHGFRIRWVPMSLISVDEKLKADESRGYHLGQLPIGISVKIFSPGCTSINSMAK